jgi:hypothetical protein
MPYTMQDSRAAFERVRQLVLQAPAGGVDVNTVLADSEFAAIITSEAERSEFIWRRGGKEWTFSEDPKLCGDFTITGTAAGDGDVTVKVGSESYTITPAAGDDNVAVATAIINAINSGSTKWNASTTAAGVVLVCPIGDIDEAGFEATVGDTGLTVASRGPFEAPIYVKFGGTVKPNGRTITFQGTASRAPQP